MKIYNKTNQIQELTVYDRGTHLSYSIYVCANSSTELSNDVAVPSLPKLINKGIFEVVSGTPVVSTPIVDDVTETSSEIPGSDTEGTLEDNFEDTVDDEEETDIDKSPQESTVATKEEATSTTYVCDICGGEYASARGLSNHKNKSHKN